MKFFIPDAKDDKEAERVYQATKKFPCETLGWQVGDRRIQSIAYREKGKPVKAEVGKPEAVSGR